MEPCALTTFLRRLGNEREEATSDVNKLAPKLGPKRTPAAQRSWMARNAESVAQAKKEKRQREEEAERWIEEVRARKKGNASA